MATVEQRSAEGSFERQPVYGLNVLTAPEKNGGEAMAGKDNHVNAFTLLTKTKSNQGARFELGDYKLRHTGVCKGSSLVKL